jgi:uncharacterized repeat protein (TIGR03803 family)
MAGALLVSTCWGQYKCRNLFDFSRPAGLYPSGSVTLDARGDIFGTASEGGFYDDGTIWEMLPSGVIRVLHSFGESGDGLYPGTQVTIDPEGDLFGTTELGGRFDHGMVWEITRLGEYIRLHSFGETSSDGLFPVAGVTVDPRGDLFGTASEGGIYSLGTVWEIDASGIYRTVHPFGGTLNASKPYGGATLDQNGDLFGTTFYGGSHGSGAVWEITANGVPLLLHSFESSMYDGQYPETGVVLDVKGDVLGTTESGGRYYYGTVWKLTPEGIYTTLHSFGGTPRDARYIYSGITLDAKGDMFGTSYEGGVHFEGAVWEISASGEYTNPFSFGGSDTEPANPQTGIAVDSNGDLFGTAPNGGSHAGGTIWELTGPPLP